MPLRRLNFSPRSPAFYGRRARRRRPSFRSAQQYLPAMAGISIFPYFLSYLELPDSSFQTETVEPSKEQHTDIQKRPLPSYVFLFSSVVAFILLAFLLSSNHIFHNPGLRISTPSSFSTSSVSLLYPDPYFSSLCLQSTSRDIKSANNYFNAQEAFDRKNVRTAFLSYYHAFFCSDGSGAPQPAYASGAMAIIALSLEDALANHYDKAESDLRFCLSHDVRSNEGRLLLGDVLWLEGKGSQARLLWRDAIERPGYGYQPPTFNLPADSARRALSQLTYLPNLYLKEKNSISLL